MADVRSTVISRDLITTALISMIATATSKPCGDHEAPSNADLATGYTIVYTVEGGEYNGAPLWAPEADAGLVYQVTSVGRRRDQAEWIADRVRLTLCARVTNGGFQVAFPDPAGLKVIHRAPEGTPPGVIPEGIAPNRVFNIPERFRLSVVTT